MVDEARQLATELGLRPYRVFSVAVRWTGGATGRGDAVIDEERELLPTPRVEQMNPLRAEATPVGRRQRGEVRLREVSPRYTEQEITGLCCSSPGRDVFIEIRMDNREGPQAERRRFAVVATPYRDTERFEWVVVLTSQQGDRAPSGKVAEDVSSPAEAQMHRLVKP